MAHGLAFFCPLSLNDADQPWLLRLLPALLVLFPCSIPCLLPAPSLFILKTSSEIGAKS